MRKLWKKTPKKRRFWDQNHEKSTPEPPKMRFENQRVFRTPFFAIFGGFSRFLVPPGEPGFARSPSQRSLGSEFASKNCEPARLVGPSRAPETEFGTEPCVSSLFCMIFTQFSFSSQVFLDNFLFGRLAFYPIFCISWELRKSILTHPYHGFCASALFLQGNVFSCRLRKKQKNMCFFLLTFEAEKLWKKN